MFGIGGKIETMIGEGAEIHGKIDIQGSIYVNGKLSGDILCDGLITLGDKAQVKGDLRAPEVVVGGRLEGQIYSSAKVELLATATVSGDIRTPRLVISEGALFEGNCEMIKPGSSTVEFKSARK